MPIETATLAYQDPKSATAPPYVDEDPNLAMVEQGLNAAEDEMRDTVADAYEANARLSDDPLESLDDIDFGEAGGDSSAPELAAMHEEFIPTLDDEDDEDVI